MTMRRKRARSKDSSSIIAIAAKSDWRFSALLSAGILILTFFIIPALVQQNFILRSLFVGIKMMMAMAGGSFAILALYKFIFQTRSSGRIESIAPSPVVKRSGISPSMIDDYQVIHGWSKDKTEFSNLGLQGSTVVANQRPASWSIELLQQIEWKLFEDVSAAYYKEKGIRAELTKLGADGGVDIKLFQDDSSLPTSIVQCKAWNSMVGVKPIREFLGVMTHEKILKGFYMTSSSYSQEAKEVAQANRITLIDGAMFLAMIKRLPSDAKQRLLELATSGEFTTPSCPHCGIKMVKRTSNRGGFWGCSNYPRCHQKLYMKAA